MPEISDLYHLFLQCGSVTTDSRNVRQGALFFGLKGDVFDGNLFASAALQNGAKFAVVDNPDVCLDNRYILVDNVLESLQELSRFHRRRSDAVVIGLTGSNGKTTTKELTGAVLASAYKTVITPGNLNNHIGVPLTILAIDENTEFAVVEMGANHEGEINALCEVADPDYGIITNIGKAHLEGFGGFEGVIKAKSELYRYLKKKNGLIFYNNGNPLLSDLSESMERISYGARPDAMCSGRILESFPALRIMWNFQDIMEGDIVTHLPGEYNFENVMAAICVGAYFKVQANNIDKSIQNYLPNNNRSQQYETGRNTLILDAYNANPSSMKAALENFSRVSGTNKLAILGDMMELGQYARAEHEEIIRLLENFNINDAILIGGNFCRAATGSRFLCFHNTEEAYKWLSEHLISNKTILIKGSRRMALEKLASRL
jgi:UDP-N-acetylmuramoyl-tripeptide--D-alanyl-D-alanine ligase